MAGVEVGAFVDVAFTIHVQQKLLLSLRAVLHGPPKSGLFVKEQMGVSGGGGREKQYVVLSLISGLFRHSGAIPEMSLGERFS